jgi:putative inorganic carbon (hco3(-)) transporter
MTSAPLASHRESVVSTMLLVLAAAAMLAATTMGMAALPLMLAVAVAGLLVMYANPAIGLMVLVFVIYTNAAAVAEDFHGVSLFNKLLLPLLMGLLAVRWLVRGEKARDLPLMTVLFAAYVASVAIAMFYGREPELTADKVVMLIKDTVFGLVLIGLMTSVFRFRVACMTLIAAAAGLSALGIIQFATGRFDLVYGGFAQATVQHLVGRLDSWRISGPLTDPNYFAQVLVLVLPLALDRIFNGRHVLERLTGAGASVLIGFALVLTYSRGGLIAAVVVVMAVGWFNARHQAFAVAAIFAVIAVLASPFIPVEYIARLSTISGTLELLTSDGGASDAAISGRLSEMMAAVHMFLANPLIGVGYGQYEVHYQDTAMLSGLMARGADREAHSLYLQVLAERGLLGALPFVGLLALTAYSVRRGRARLLAAGLTSDAALARAYGIGLLGYFIAATFLHDGYDRYFWLSIAIALALPQITARPSASPMAPAYRSSTS